MVKVKKGKVILVIKAYELDRFIKLGYTEVKAKSKKESNNGN
jgi:hypothetical protein